MNSYKSFYPHWMKYHDRSMLAFKNFFENEYIEFNIVLDSNKRNSSDINEIERAEIVKEAKEFNIDYIEEEGDDDGYIQIKENVVPDIYDDFEIHFDWEHRRDWVLNYKNIPIYMKERTKYGKNELFYYNPILNLSRSNHFKTYNKDNEFDTVRDVITYLDTYNKSARNPYFIYSSLGQFSRKLEKKTISLSIQCAQFAPQWKNGRIEPLEHFCYPEPKGELTPRDNKDAKSYFAVAWHEDFGNLWNTTRKSSIGGIESGTYSSTRNFGIFSFTKEGIILFREVLIKQLKNGLIKDRYDNIIPQIRQWNNFTV